MYRPDIPRTGIGYDVHRLVVGRRCVLGGVAIPFERGLEGHSDADVVLHALADALLGAAALGDIGRHFPPTDPAWKDMDSREIARAAVGKLAELGMEPIHADITVIAEAPRINPHLDAMQRSIGACLSLPPETISIKATTNERMGFVGREEGIAAIAVATIAAKIDEAS
ncbi:MAG: 2-C-methyl-D-erythritol 2,4-cyclodiphosphate synthase [Chloroflexia bacterium]|jgi:2-C-methyl-D-erythritol 2,4-cyclodiphosphate synthase|nr:2-C-methyl-D-erythritol 2,4-cyclodiphosphate synthase [Chloroflexia bacterium]